ncbi:MAG: carbohydrate binding family 9 domain-containing protein [Myxococcales bacterium FL481]|nr:MAG: carbohydrate binding family 9 domain-containing protein [Myxococcales bacterium FL481]
MFCPLAAIFAANTLGGFTPTELAAQQRTIQAARAHEEITIDGHPDEAVWKRAELHDDFVMRSPELGGAPPSRTTLRVAYDDLALYVLVEANMDPDEVVLRTLRRDAFAIFSDDAVSVKIDPRRDLRTALIFSTNASGTQLEIMSLDDGRVNMPQWDAVWDVEVWRHDRGYTVEYRLPFAILGVDAEGDGDMGLNISRDHQAANATYDWRLILPPRRPTSASAFGVIEGIHGILAARALEITPYVAGYTDFSPSFTVDPRRRPNASVGGDLRAQVGKSSYVEASVLTDFAQVEADEVQVARDRFPLFFPERRPFFINGLDTFNFGRPGEAQLFFSRRIGLRDGRAIPVAAGVKAYGRSPKLVYGVLNVQTLRSIAEPPQDETEDPEVDIPAENFSVGRIAWRPTPRTSVGVLALGKHRFGDPDEAVFSGGADLDITAAGGKLRWYNFFAQTFDREPDEVVETTPTSTLTRRSRSKLGRTAASNFTYDGLYLRPAVDFTWSDTRFSAPLGFYRRPGTASHGARFFVAPRPRALGLQELLIGPFGRVVTSPDYTERLTADGGARFEARWRSSWLASYNLRAKDDRVDDAFELYGYTVDARRYQGTSHAFRVRSPSRFALGGELNYEYGQLFAGKMHQIRGRIVAKFNKHASLAGSYTHLVGHLGRPEANAFSFGFANGTLNLALNRNVAWDTSLRLNLDPSEPTMAVQSRFRWRYRRGSDIFLVYTTSQPVGTALPDATIEPFHAIAVKATYYFQARLGG